MVLNKTRALENYVTWLNKHKQDYSEHRNKTLNATAHNGKHGAFREQ